MGLAEEEPVPWGRCGLPRRAHLCNVAPRLPQAAAGLISQYLLYRCPQGDPLLLSRPPRWSFPRLYALPAPETWAAGPNRSSPLPSDIPHCTLAPPGGLFQKGFCFFTCFPQFLSLLKSRLGLTKKRLPPDTALPSVQMVLPPWRCLAPACPNMRVARARGMHDPKGDTFLGPAAGVSFYKFLPTLGCLFLENK